MPGTIVLVFLACLVGSAPSSSGACRQVEIPLEATMDQCGLMAGQIEIARWLAENPGRERRGAFVCTKSRGT